MKEGDSVTFGFKPGKAKFEIVDRAEEIIANLIRASPTASLVLLATLLVAAWGTWAVLRAPVDALPDLSDVR